MAFARVVSVAILAVAASGPDARGAPTYDQWACRLPGEAAAPADGFGPQHAGAAVLVDQCSAGGGLDAVVSGPGTADWRYAPPPGTTIAAVSIRRRVAIGGASRAVFALVGAADRCDAASRCGEGIYDLGAPAGALDFRLSCPVGCRGGGRLSIESVRVTLADPSPPQVSGAAIAGTSVSFTATDVGGGVYEAALVVDGAERARHPVTPGSRGCRAPFTRAIPCPLRAHGTLALDVRHLAAGDHSVAVAVYDATDVNRALSAPVALRVGERGRLVSRARSVRAAYGRHAVISGRLVDRRGRGIAGAALQVAGLGASLTDARGAFRITIPPGPERTVTVVYRAVAGARSVAARRAWRVVVPAPVALVASRARLSNGQSLSLFARLATTVPAGTAHVAFQVLIAGRWRTFADRPLAATGPTCVRHRFHATFRRMRYRFRAVITGRAGFPFATGRSRAVGVRVN